MKNGKIAMIRMILGNEDGSQKHYQRLFTSMMSAEEIDEDIRVWGVMEAYLIKRHYGKLPDCQRCGSGDGIDMWITYIWDENDKLFHPTQECLCKGCYESLCTDIIPPQTFIAHFMRSGIGR